MNDLALDESRGAGASTPFRSLLRRLSLALAAALLIAGCGDDSDAGGGGGGKKGPGDVIRVVTEDETVEATQTVSPVNVFWFDDGGTFRATMTGIWEDVDGGSETITARLAIFGARGERTPLGDYTLTDSDVRTAGTATLKLEYSGKALDVVSGTLALQAIDGEVDSSASTEEKLRRLSLTFEGTSTQREQPEPAAIEGEIVWKQK